MQNHAESSGNYIKNSILDPKRAKLDQKSEHGGKPFGKTYLFKMHSKNYVFYIQTTFFDGFNVFLAEKWYRTIMKSPHKASFGPATCEI